MGRSANRTLRRTCMKNRSTACSEPLRYRRAACNSWPSRCFRLVNVRQPAQALIRLSLAWHRMGQPAVVPLANGCHAPHFFKHQVDLDLPHVNIWLINLQCPHRVSQPLLRLSNCCVLLVDGGLLHHADEPAVRQARLNLPMERRHERCSEA